MAIAQQPHPEPAEQGEEQRQAGDEAERQQPGQWRRRRTEVMDADVDPADARGEQAEAVAPAALRRLFRPGFAQAEVEQCHRQQGQRPDVEGGQRKRGQRAGQ